MQRRKSIRPRSARPSTLSSAARRATRYLVEPLEARRLLSAVSWTGMTGDNQWTTPGNWSTGALPGPGDDVTINVEGNPTITLASGTQSINSLNCADTLAITGGSLLLASTSQVANFSLPGGDLGGSGDVTIKNSLSWTGGSMDGTGRTILASGASGTFTYPALEREFDNAGSVSLTQGYLGHPDLTASAGWTFDNLSGGTFTMGDGTRLFANNQGYSGVTPLPGVFDNAGTLTIAGAAQTVSAAPDVALDNTGTVNVQSGTLELDGGGTFAGPLTVAAGATLNLSGGVTWSAGGMLGGAGAFNFQSGTQTFAGGQFAATGPVTITGASVQFNAATSIANLSLPGGDLGGSGDVTITNKLSWTGGSMDGTGRTILAAGASGSLTYALLAREFDNAGSVSLTQGYLGHPDLTASAGWTFDNLAGATFTMGDGTRLFANNQGYSGVTPLPGVFDNAGTLTVAGASNMVGGLADVSLDNTGMVNVQSGMLKLDGPLTNTGTLQAITGGILNVANAGVLRGTLSADAKSSLQIASGTTLNAATLSGAITFTNETINVTNGLTLANGAVVTLAQTGSNNCMLNFIGTQALGGAGQVVLTNSADTELTVADPAGVGGAVLTIGPGVTVHGQGTISGPPDATVVNQGSVLADVPGAALVTPFLSSPTRARCRA